MEAAAGAQGPPGPSTRAGLGTRATQVGASWPPAPRTPGGRVGGTRQHSQGPAALDQHLGAWMSPLAWAWQKHNLAGMGPLLSSPGQATLGTADQGPAGMAGVSCPVLFPSKDRVRVAAQRPCQVVAGGGLAVTLWAAQENWVQGPRLLTAPLSLLIALLPAGPGPRVSREGSGGHRAG